MSIWLLADLAIIAVVWFFGYISMKKGFLNSSYRGISSLAALIIVFGCHTSFQGYLEQSAVGDTIREKVRLRVEETVNTDEDGTEENSDESKAVEIVKEWKLPEFMSEWLTNSLESEKKNEFKQSVVDSVTDFIFPVVMQIVSVVLLYIIVRIGLWLLFCILRIVVKTPFLKAFDKVLGMIAGGVNAILAVYVAAAILMLLTPPDSGIAAGINSTYLFKFFYYNNLLTNLFF